MDQQPTPNPDEQVWDVFGISSSVIFQYIDYNTLLAKGPKCQAILMTFLKNVLIDADREAETCKSSNDVQACYTRVKDDIKTNFNHGKNVVIDCVKAAGIEVNDQALDAIDETLINDTQNVVLSAFEKTTSESSVVDANVAEPESPEIPAIQTESKSENLVASNGTKENADEAKKSEKKLVTDPQPSLVTDTVTPNDDTKLVHETPVTNNA